MELALIVLACISIGYLLALAFNLLKAGIAFLQLFRSMTKESEK